MLPGFFKTMTQPSITRLRHKTELISADIVTYRDNTTKNRKYSNIKKNHTGINTQHYNNKDDI